MHQSGPQFFLLFVDTSKLLVHRIFIEVRSKCKNVVHAHQQDNRTSHMLFSTHVNTNDADTFFIFLLEQSSFRSCNEITANF